MELDGNSSKQEPRRAIRRVTGKHPTLTRINAMISNHKMKQNRQNRLVFWLSTWSGLAQHFFSGSVETNKPPRGFIRIPKTQKPQLRMTSSEAPSHQGITFTVLLMSLSQGFDLNFQDARQPWSDRKWLGLRGKTNFPQPPSLLMEHRIQHHTPTPAEYQSLNLYSPTCSWSLHYGPFPPPETLASLWLKPSLRR